MLTKAITMLKNMGLFTLLFFLLISCEKEIENIGVDLINNNVFSTDNFITEVSTGGENVDRVIASSLEQYLLGVYADNEFGEIKGSIVSQLLMPATGDDYSYGTNSAIDSVLIFIPYQSTRLDNDIESKPVFEIDSVIGNPDTEFKLSIYELKTFFNSLDPSDPSKPQLYYSDKVFEKGATPFYSGDFKVNPNDTVAYIKRYMPDGITVYDIDTIKQADLSPSIKIALDEDMIQQIFVDNASGPEFSSFDEFSHYFRGFYIEAEELATNKSHMLSLAMSNTKMVIYYSNDENEGDLEDLDDDGILGEQNVRVRHSYEFMFSTTKKSNVLERDYTISKQSGDERLYVQGAAGSIATVDLFINDDLPELQNNEYLITGASITLYVDPMASSDIAPEQLYIYNYEENSQIIDMMTEGFAAIRGRLIRDNDGNPEKYVFSITDYISEVLKSQDPENLITLGIKVYNPTDIPRTTLDTQIRDYSWNPKGVVLYNENPNEGENRAKFEIYYSKLNND